ncbi:MAG: autotransporter-associated beta strand repeat-containing protein [Planctomycetes bacterium]|nr:autotransporter-associated beta strand repeat-containing protein [Planctomycetota bacterium]
MIRTFTMRHFRAHFVLAFASVVLLNTTPLAFATPITSGLQLWLDGSDPDGDAVVEGVGETGISGATITWADKSGNTRNFTQSTAARQPVYTATGFSNSKGAFDFTGGNGVDANGDTLFYGGAGPLTPGDDDYTYVVVWNADLTNQFRYAYTQGDGAGNGERGGLILSNTTYGFNGLNADANGFVPYTAAQRNLSIMQVDTTTRFGLGGANPNVRIYDEGTLSTALTGNPTTLNIQQGQTYVASSVSTTEFFDGKIAEIMVYDRVLSINEVNQVGNYLWVKYDAPWASTTTATQYWDGNGNTAGASATPNGTWGTSNFWNSDVAGGAGTFKTTTVAQDAVIFSAGGDATGAYTVTVSGNQEAGSIVFEDGSATITGGTSLSIWGSVTHNSTGATTINSPSVGVSTLAHNNGKLVLNGANATTTNTWTIQNSGNAANGWLEVAPGGDWKASAINVGGTSTVNGAVMHQTGGSLSVNGAVTVGSGTTNSIAFYYMSGGTLNSASMRVGGTAANSSYFGMSAGTLSVAGNLQVAESNVNGGVAYFDLLGGSATAATITTNGFQDGKQFVNVGGGTLSVTGAGGVTLGGSGVQNRSPGRLTLAGGVTSVQKIVKNTATDPTQDPSTVFFNGGTLRALATNNTDFLGGVANPGVGSISLGNTGVAPFVRILSGGGTIDTNGADVTANTRFLGPITSTGLSIASVPVTTLGSNYSIPSNSNTNTNQMLTFTGGGGTGAIGRVVLDANGGIAGIIITDPGSGYTSAPTSITIANSILGPGGLAAVLGTAVMRPADAGGLTKVGSGILTLARGDSEYLGPTSINAGVLSLGTLANGGANSSIGKSSSVAGNLILNGGTLRYTGGAVGTDRLFSVGTSNGTFETNGGGAVNFSNAGAMGFNGQSGARTLTLTGTNTGANTIAAVIGNNGGATSLTKSGSGNWTLSGNSSYSGPTLVSQGTLALLNNNNNNISGSTTINIAGGAFLDTTGLGSGLQISRDLILAGGQTLKGTGTVLGNLTVAAGSKLSPGSSPGTINQVGIQTWDPAGALVVEMNDALGTAGSDPGWDLLNITGSLDLSGLGTGNEFIIELTSLDLANAPGLAANFNPLNYYEWLIVDTTNDIATYSGANQFTVDTTAFDNSFSGTFSVLRGDQASGDNTQLYLVYAAAQTEVVPEPSTLALGALGMLGLGVLAARRRRKQKIDASSKPKF